MGSKLTLYVTPPSPPSRTVLLLARYLKLDVEVKYSYNETNEQYSPEFLKLNPQHKVPVLVDGDFVLTESRAIIAYLVNSRAPRSDLYPTNPKARAIVDNRIHFEAGTVSRKLMEIVDVVLYKKNRSIPQDIIDELKEIFKSVDKYLENSQYFASDKLTIADFALAGSIASFWEMRYIFEENKNICEWYMRVQTLPNFEENHSGAQVFTAMLRGGTDGPLF